MKKNSYMTRALSARDRRFEKLLGKLGYAAPEAQPVEAPVETPAEDIAAIRAEYETVVGKRPFMGWDAETLREKIAAAKAGE